jgi:hypothetical protein
MKIIKGSLVLAMISGLVLLGCETGGTGPSMSDAVGDTQDELGSDTDMLDEDTVDQEATERPDTEGPDGEGDITIDIVPGGSLAPCSENRDCDSGFCVEGPNGNICTQTCMFGECPPDFLCAGIVNTYPDVVFVCLPKFSRVCQPCTTDTQCGGGKCIAMGDGNYCSVPCQVGGDACPAPYECVAADPNDENSGGFCVPPSGTCECRTNDAGVKRFCEITNSIGTCFGYETCDPAVGFVNCDARTPAEEECNGIDDDCNGIPDDGLSDGEPCENTNEFGSCRGTQVCMGPLGWTCTAATPAEEVCDGIDNDCNGEIDDPFKIDGKYGTLEHCGACNRSCLEIFPNATPGCDLSKEVPRCVVVECDPGYYRLNDYQCIPLTSVLCSSCVIDDDCIIEGARCIPIGDGGNFCGQPCSGDIDCPTGYNCLPAEGGPDQCQPTSGSCACTGDTSISRGCSVTYQDPLNPTAPSYTCFGVQRCQEEGWGPCELPAEICDGLDNNCNGQIDEGFLDPISGKYVDDENCGVCGNNCAANQVINGYGVCDSSKVIPDCKVVCNPGFFDVDGNPGNGCECEFISDYDPPGGGDDNCDGIDGSVDSGIFVAKWGTIGASGTIEDPLLNIQSAIDFAASSPDRKEIYVATGVYTESLELKAGVGIFGGYSADFRVREPIAYETVVFGSVPTVALPGAITAIGISGPETKIDGFVVFGYTSRGSGANSIGVYVRDCDNSLTISNSRIVGGDGGNGLPGTVGASGLQGKNGAPGKDAYDINQVNCSNAQWSPGGAGGAHQCGGVDVSGGDGGTAICPDFDESTTGCAESSTSQTRKPEETGKDGKNNGGTGGIAGLDAIINRSCSYYSGACGTCSVPSASKQGGPGAPGNDGNAGAGGLRCADPSGTVSGGLWQPSPSGNGAAGSHGAGGGGGGAAGGVETLNCSGTFYNRGHTDIGGSGGGGGSGGCGAMGGVAGASGGGSFAVFVVFQATPASVPVIRDLVILPGQGGHGGNGGPGGVGGKGGAGGLGGKDGAGQDIMFCTSEGGAGANGGAGGHGGGGAGGCGGPSYGLFVHGADAGLINGYKTAGLTFQGTGSGGIGGIGGISFGNAGQDGAAGQAAEYNF